MCRQNDAEVPRLSFDHVILHSFNIQRKETTAHQQQQQKKSKTF